MSGPATWSTSHRTSYSLRPEPADTTIRCFCFAVAVKGAGPVDYTTH